MTINNNEIPMNWYVIQVASGKEQIIADKIKDKHPEFNLLIPTETVVKLTKTFKSTYVKQKMYPGYIMINIPSTTEAVDAVESIEGVRGFVGNKMSNGLPASIPDSQVESVREDVEAKEKKFTEKTCFEIGDRVRIIAGPFINFDAIIEGIHGDKIAVNITVFDQKTSMHLSPTDIEKQHS